MRSVLKGVAEAVLSGSGAAAVARRRHASRTVVLAYHNIVPHGAPVAGDVSLHLPQASFARQLDRLLQTHDVVPLTGVLEAHNGDRPRAVITFDDACQGAVTAGVEELRRRALPATVFVAPGFVGGKSFWWDALSEEGGLADALRQQALDELQGRDARVRAWSAARGVREVQVPWHQTGATESQLAEAAGGQITLGSHSWSHPDLTSLSEAELVEELTSPLDWLRARWPNVVPWLAFPYGHTSPAVARAAQSVGYAGALRVSGGWLPADPAPQRFDLPRLNIPSGLSLRGFELRIAGLLS